MSSNLTFDELKYMIGGEESDSPLLRHIIGISQNYLNTYHGNARLSRLRPEILYKILGVWMDFYYKYGNNRNDMNSIIERGIMNNYDFTSNLLLRQSWGISGRLEVEILKWNSENRNKIMNILEIERRNQIGSGKKKLRNKSRKKKSRKKKSRKKKSRKKNNKNWFR